MKIAVIYESKYGATKQYAAWIAEALKADLAERAKVKAEDLLKYDAVIYGGGLYAGGIRGIDFVTKNKCSELVLFTVGLSDPQTTDYSHIIAKDLPEELRKKTKVFHLRGGAWTTKSSILFIGQ